MPTDSIQEQEEQILFKFFPSTTTKYRQGNSRSLVTFTVIMLSVIISSCSVNPVTGENEFSLVSAEQEVAIGRQNYQPSQQVQGGRYVVDPELSVYVSQIGQKLAKVSDRPQLPYEFVVLNNDVPNAWALPGGKIAINRGLLLYLEDESQLAAVLGHEIVHAAARHGALQMTQASVIGLGTQVVTQSSQQSPYGELIASTVGITAAAWQARYGRQDELDSDRYGMNYMVNAGYDPQGAVELQEVFVRLSEGRQSDFISGLFASHPPSQERVKLNRERAEKLKDRGGVRNVKAFQNATAKIRNDQPAYQLHQQAISEIKNNNFDKALTLNEQAIKAQPKENLFWETKAQILDLQNKPREALAALNQAVSIYPEYFSPLLARGVIQLKLNDFSSAEKDLLASQKLLDTPVTNFMLGHANLGLGQRAKAIQYFQIAVAAGGDIGQAATKELEQLGITTQTTNQ
ncbi:M48 family metalloprotease [Aurantivibrio infirmus]